MPKKKTTTQEEGDVYVTASGFYAAPKIDAAKITKIRENIYLAGALDKQQRMLFKDKKDFMVRGYDPGGDIDDDLTAALNEMCSAPDVDLWYALQVAWRESAEWGPALFNPVWGYEGSEYRLLKLRNLPSETFAGTGGTYSAIKNELLPGILLNADGQIEFWQKQAIGTSKRLENVVMMTDPIRRGLGGKPLILPIVPIISMLDFAWSGAMQQAHRLGAGGLFSIKVTNPQKDDKQYAQKILKNIGKNVAFQLRENMEFLSLPITETHTAKETIEMLDQLIATYFSPMRSISKEGTLIGGSSSPEFDLYMAYIQGQQAWVEDSFERLLQPYLDVNGYDGYSLVVDIPAPTVDRSELWLKIADMGFRTQAATKNELRDLLERAGAPTAQLDEAGLLKLQDEYSRMQPVSPLFQKANLAVEAMKADQLDPYSVVGKKEAKKILTTALGIEDGEEKP
jgi:hypothetical protein